MKKQCIELIDSQSNEILELSKRLFETPELGFKEHKTKVLNDRSCEPHDQQDPHSGVPE